MTNSQVETKQENQRIHLVVMAICYGNMLWSLWNFHLVNCILHIEYWLTILAIKNWILNVDLNIWKLKIECWLLIQYLIFNVFLLKKSAISMIEYEYN